MPETEGGAAPVRAVGIIMDGNRRWAKSKGLPVFEGHRSGYQKLKEAVRWSKERGVKHVIVFAFSSENWNRVAEEVGYLMDLMRFVFRNEMKTLAEEKIRVNIIGDLARLPEDLQKDVANTMAETAANDGITLTLCVSYGGREELLRAARKMLAEKIDPAALDEKTFSDHLDTAGIPDPDLVIRTSGEMRTSGFLPWQAVYSELFFTETMWPDLSREEYLGILDEFSRRHRRMGK